MRISDWSSDVCSSDLGAHRRRHPHADQAAPEPLTVGQPRPSLLEKPMNKPFRKRFDTARLSREEAARQGRAAKLAWEYMPGPGRAVAFLHAHDVEIGRASSRERVCPYV